MINYLEANEPGKAWIIDGQSPEEILTHRKFLLSATLSAISSRSIAYSNGYQLMLNLVNPSAPIAELNEEAFRTVASDADYLVNQRIEQLAQQAIPTDALFSEISLQTNNSEVRWWINKEGVRCEVIGGAVTPTLSDLEEIEYEFGKDSIEAALAEQHRDKANKVVQVFERIPSETTLRSSRWHFQLVSNDPDGTIVPFVTILDPGHPARTPQHET